MNAYSKPAIDVREGYLLLVICHWANDSGVKVLGGGGWRRVVISLKWFGPGGFSDAKRDQPKPSEVGSFQSEPGLIDLVGMHQACYWQFSSLSRCARNVWTVLGAGPHLPAV